MVERRAQLVGLRGREIALRLQHEEIRGRTTGFFMFLLDATAMANPWTNCEISVTAACHEISIGNGRISQRQEPPRGSTDRHPVGASSLR
jgi:hypothetical protein